MIRIDDPALLAAFARARLAPCLKILFRDLGPDGGAGAISRETAETIDVVINIYGMPRDKTRPRGLIWSRVVTLLVQRLGVDGDEQARLTALLVSEQHRPA